MRMTSKCRTTSNEDYLKIENNIKNENNFKYADNLKNEANEFYLELAFEM